ncbi:MAG: VCBS repeat-containing protein, partial [Planctomycetes bacterium]|nr:VCBS repeat-containing protein [Planctomycetota bacterium]
MPRRPLNKRYVLMLRWGGPGLIAALVISLLVLIGGVRKDPAALNADGGVDGLTSILSREITPDMVRFTFDDVTGTAGIPFRHFPAVRQSLLPEDMGSGVAWGDYDNDGDPDLFLVNFHGSILDPIPDHPQRGRCALYRNDLNGTFTDVSAEAGLDIALFGMAASWGDYDNDDDLDLYITAYGRNLLFENNGDGTFTDITEAAGVGDESFSAGCAWTDYNGDGLIDLYVCNYVQFVHRKGDASRNTRQYGSEIPYTINPSSYQPQSNRMYRNNGDGTFTDVAKEIGVDNPDGRSLGVVCFDFDDDGLIDLYVANDVSSNGVFRNLGDGTFADIGAISLAADYRGAMGLAVGDFDHDDDFDLFVTHWIAQENAFFENMFSEGWTDDAG